MQIIGGPFRELGGDLYRRESGHVLFGTGGARQFDVGYVVEVELLNLADEVRNGGRHADLLLEVVQAAQVDGAPLEGVVLALGFRWKNRERTPKLFKLANEKFLQPTTLPSSIRRRMTFLLVTVNKLMKSRKVLPLRGSCASSCSRRFAPFLEKRTVCH